MLQAECIKSSKEGINYYVFIGFCIFVALGLIAFYVSGISPVKKGEYVDTDCYVHLIRATDLYETGNWYHPAKIKSNTPYGDTLPWSRVFDILLLTGAIPLSYVLGFKAAFFWWGVALGPVLLAFTLVALNWATRALLSKDGTFLVILLFLSQTVVRCAFLAGRPDHHSLLLLFFILLMGFAFRLINQPLNRQVCWLAGLTAAVAMWVSIESMVAICLMIGSLVFFWVLYGQDFLDKGFHFNFSFCAFGSICLLLERPLSNITAVEYDRISIVFISLLGLMVLFWVAVLFVARRTGLLNSKGGRFCFTIIGWAAIIFLMWLVFPRFFEGPLADVDPRIIPLWLNKINEIQPIFAKSIPLTISIQLVGSAVVSFAFLLYILLRHKDSPVYKGWIYVTIITPIYCAVAFYQLRWAIYAQTLFSVIMTALLYRILMWRRGQGNKLWHSLRNSLITLIFALGFLYAGAFAGKYFGTENSQKQNKRISLISMCAFLNDSPIWGHQNLRILTHFNFAGEILYRTQCEVLGSNYHHNSQGILDSYDIMTADTDEKALEILKRRQIDAIFICPEIKEKFFVSDSGQIFTFYQRLCDGQTPPWLTEVELPQDLSRDFLMFEISYENPLKP